MHRKLFIILKFKALIKFTIFEVEPKQTEDQPKQFDREHSLVFFLVNLGFSRFVLVCFEIVCFGCFTSIPN